MELENILYVDVNVMQQAESILAHNSLYLSSQITQTTFSFLIPNQWEVFISLYQEYPWIKHVLPRDDLAI